MDDDHQHHLQLGYHENTFVNGPTQPNFTSRATAMNQNSHLTQARRQFLKTSGMGLGGDSTRLPVATKFGCADPE